MGETDEGNQECEERREGGKAEGEELRRRLLRGGT